MQVSGGFGFFGKGRPPVLLKVRLVRAILRLQPGLGLVELATTCALFVKRTQCLRVLGDVRTFEDRS